MGADLLEECVADLSAPGGERDYKAFQDTFCLRCRNPNCIHAKWVDDRFSARVATQPDRFFNPKIIEGKSPKFADLVDFVDNIRNAMRLEIADRKGDWEVPEVPIVDGRVENGDEKTTDEIDEAVRRLAQSKGKKEPKLPDHRKAATKRFVDETEEMMAEENAHCEESAPPPPEPEPPAPAPQLYPMGNTPMPATGLMVGGGPVPAPAERAPAVEEDDWTPKPQVRKVKPGAKIKMSNKPPKGK